MKAMTLTDLAHIFEIQMLNYAYTIITTEKKYIIFSYPENFAHLVGVERTKELKSIESYRQFYFDCVAGKYNKTLSDYNYNNKQDRRYVNMKTSNFPLFKDVLLNAEKLIHIKDTNGDCKTFCINTDLIVGNKTKHTMLVFKRNKENSVYVPASIMTNKNPYNSPNITVIDEEDIFNIIHTPRIKWEETNIQKLETINT